jgi:hypothetical protein
MEAFQLSLGREADFDLSKITFKTASVNLNTGKSLFINGGGDPNFGGTCAFCHTNAGARSPERESQLQHQCRRRVSSGAQHPELPEGRRLRANRQSGRHLRQPHVQRGIRRGSRRYRAVLPQQRREHAGRRREVLLGPEFNNPRAPATRFNFNQTQIGQLAGFMRGVNTLQNIDVARRELKEILDNRGDPRREQDTRLQTAFEETQDGIDVLKESSLFPSAVTHLISARNLILQAQFTGDSSHRRALVQQAIAKLDAAKGAVATIAP